jgi:hypothetical protein
MIPSCGIYDLYESAGQEMAGEMLQGEEREWSKFLALRERERLRKLSDLKRLNTGEGRNDARFGTSFEIDSSAKRSGA